MAQRKKSREEIASQFYFTKSDIKKLLCESRTTAEKLFDKASKIDDLLDIRIEDTKVSLDSLCKVMGISHDQLKRHCANSAKV